MNPFLISTSAIRIPTSLSTNEWYRSITADLTRRTTDQDGNPVVRKYYIERDGYILVPRLYPIHKFGLRTINLLNDGEDIDIEFKSKWKNNLQEAGCDILESRNNGVLCMQPGEGKTVVSIGYICKTKKKSIIYVHKDSLATQWRDRFLEHSTIKEEDISFLRTATCREDLLKPIVIATVQTLGSMTKSIPDIENLMHEANFGVAIWDECHTSVSAEFFSLSSLYTPAKRTFGLSATPSRNDGNTDIIEKHVGQVYVPDGSGDTMTPKIITLMFPHGVMEHHRKYVYSKIVNGKPVFGVFDRSRYLSMLASKKNEQYVRFMKKIVKYIFDSDRICICLSDRINLLDKVSKSIPERNKVGFFIPRSGKERDSELKKQLVFSTYGSARDGTDRKEIDALVMLTPTSNLEQCIGRIVRFSPGKKQPVVFDCVDTECEEMVRSYEYRKKFYLSKEWEVTEKHFTKDT